MNIFKLITKIKEVNKGQIYNIVSTEAVLRIVAWYVTPIFYYLRLSPNVITVIALITGICAAFTIIIFGREAYVIGVALFILSIIFDHCDGNIARLKNIPTFFGRFMDGLFDIIVLGFIQIALLSIILNDISSNLHISSTIAYIFDYELSYRFILFISLLSLFSTPMQHLIADRYASYCRWIKEENNKVIPPTLRSEVSFNFVDFLNDIQLFFIILGIYSNQFIFVYFVINLITSTIMVSLYLYFSKKKMSIFANDHRSKLTEK